MNDETTEISKDDHKPECPMLDPQFPKHPLDNCDYCKMISRCEKRVRGEVIRENGDWIQMPTLALDQIKQHAAEAMRAVCIAAVEALTDSLHSHYRITCEPPSPVEWSKHRDCNPIDEIIAALRGVQP